MFNGVDISALSLKELRKEAERQAKRMAKEAHKAKK
jgi:hypothetical protein